MTRLVRWCLAGAAVVAAVALLVGLLSRWTIADTRLRDRALDDLARSSGLTITAAGRTTLRLLPRPTVELRDVAVRGAAGAIALDADALRGRLDVVALLNGRIKVSGVSVVNPTAVVDVDRLLPLLAPMFAGGGAAPAFALLHTQGLAVQAGVVRLVSADSRRDMMLTDVSGSLEWPADDASASLAGVATWRGVAGEFQVDVDKPGQLIRGGQALASARLKSTALDLDAAGALNGGDDAHFAGKLSASTPDLPGFLRTIGMPTPQLSGLHQARLDGTTTIGKDTLAFDAASLGLDDMAFDGALVVRQHDGAIALAGTLATDQMVLDPFLRAFPPLLTHGGRWSTAALDTAAIANDEIDLRISATVARWGHVLMEDGSLSLQSGGGRMEMSLGEARAYDGLLKGRIVATLDGGITDVRAEATVSRLDIKGLLKDLPGAYRATGTLTGHVAVDARGTTPAALVASLGGQGQANIHDGEVGQRLVATVFHAAPVAALLALPLAAGGGTAFDAASFDTTIDRGTLTFGDSWIAWPTERAAIDGTASLPGQRLDLKARIVAEDGSETNAIYDLAGSWRDLRLKVAKPHT